MQSDRSKAESLGNRIINPVFNSFVGGAGRRGRAAGRA
jgi:hypothetical protein